MISTEGVSPLKKIKIEPNMSDNEEDNMTYEEIRAKRMKENMAMFEVLGVNQAAEALAESISKTRVKKSTPYKRNFDSKVATLTPIRRSLRLANLPAPEILKGNINEYGLKSLGQVNGDNDENSSESNVINQDSISIPEEDSTFFEKLSADLVIKEPVNDFHTCDFNRFTQVLKSLKMNEPSFKVTVSRIYSLAIHPSETSLIIASGDKKGNIALYNKNDSDMREYHVHNAPVNCISFCSWDSSKLFSTSHDGSVRCGDIVKRTFDIIYSSDLWAGNKTKDIHSTWHTEHERNLLIGNGAGCVDVIDVRTPNKIMNKAWCHQRSVRTVQCHPLKQHYFLTSSGVGEASLWDLRSMTNKKIDPVLQFEHSRSLTSAFFSATGSSMVSTSNDNYIRIFDTNKLNKSATKPVKKIQHDNHTGRWLSVFKAKWNPGRDDTFFIGSMLVPKRIQIFNSNGNLLHNLISESVTTYCPVIEVHPTQAIYVGGNASGRLHIFSTEQQL